MIEAWIPPWMSNVAPPPETDAAWAAWRAAEDERRKPLVAAGKKRCQQIAALVALVPVFGPPAAAAGYAACLHEVENPAAADRSVFGPVDAASTAAFARGAPRPPQLQLDATAAQKAAHQAAFTRWQGAYARWLVDDLAAQLPELSARDLGALTDEQRKARLEAIGQYAAVAERVRSPAWLRTVLHSRSVDLARQMGGKSWSPVAKVAAGGAAATATGLFLWLLLRGAGK